MNLSVLRLPVRKGDMKAVHEGGAIFWEGT
jgi:hypothetical protein